MPQPGLNLRIRVSDQQLADINGAFKWIMFQRDPAGRTVGGGNWDYPLVDTRLQLLLDRLGLAGRAKRPGPAVVLAHAA